MYTKNIGCRLTFHRMMLQTCSQDTYTADNHTAISRHREIAERHAGRQAGIDSLGLLYPIGRLSQYGTVATVPVLLFLRQCALSSGLDPAYRALVDSCSYVHI